MSGMTMMEARLLNGELTEGLRLIDGDCPLPVTRGDSLLHWPLTEAEALRARSDS